MTEIICAGITGICTVVCAIVGVLISKNNKQNELRQQQQILMMDMLNATMELTIANSNSLLKSRENNGNVEKAYKAADEASAKYHQFLEQTALKHMV